eukprot:gene19329-21253_t
MDSSQVADEKVIGNPLYLGLDLSTQGLKALVIDKQLEIAFECSVSFDNDLPEFGTAGGVTKRNLEVTSPVLMWVHAVDKLLETLNDLKFPFHLVKGISGTAQQHGSVYWKTGAESHLRTLDPKKTLFAQLEDSFAIYNSPVWMDSSTSEFCRNLETVVGGPEVLVEITGSRAYERFTGSQIAKIYSQKPNQYNCCERISLISSFLASLFLGSYAPIDYSDGSGMNLLNIHSKSWEENLLDACAPDLVYRLGNPVSSNSIIGKISDYMAKRYNFQKDCLITAFTGDNPASLVGMCLNDGDVAVSLGTSDTLMFSVKEPKQNLDGHIFVNPLDDNHYMAMLCYKNGSLTRECIRNNIGIPSWEEFEISLKRTPVGNSGNIGIYFVEQEIIPFAKGVFRWNSENSRVEYFEKDVEIRALIEGQLLAKRIHSEQLGFQPGITSRILATGGASKNMSILQVMADIFNCSVYRIQDTTNAACLGCAYTAKSLATTCKDQISMDLINISLPLLHAASPCEEAVQLYNTILKRYANLEKILMSM